jgi:hypothetical protein
MQDLKNKGEKEGEKKTQIPKLTVYNLKFILLTSFS